MAADVPGDAVITGSAGYLRACIDAAIQSPESFDLAVLLPQLARFLAAADEIRSQAAAAEREACAQLAEQVSAIYVVGGSFRDPDTGPHPFADLIRARSDS
jgi:hypothetical protein